MCFLLYLRHRCVISPCLLGFLSQSIHTHRKEQNKNLVAREFLISQMQQKPPQTNKNSTALMSLSLLFFNWSLAIQRTFQPSTSFFAKSQNNVPHLMVIANPAEKACVVVFSLHSVTMKLLESVKTVVKA